MAVGKIAGPYKFSGSADMLRLRFHGVQRQLMVLDLLHLVPGQSRRAAIESGRPIVDISLAIVECGASRLSDIVAAAAVAKLL